MKPAPFDYACPTTVEEAVALLASRSGDAKPIAGGQSLVPLLAFRLARPTLLVDLRKLPGLDQIEISDEGVRLGARVRWRDIEGDERLCSAHPLLAAAVSHVAHHQIRNRGTIGGSLAHADPAAEMPGVAVACDAEITVVGTSGLRVVPAADFFLGALTTVLEPDELIVELRLPPWPARRLWAFEEFARRRGDFAMAGIAAFYDEEETGRARNAHFGVIGACRRPHRLTAAEAIVNGGVIDESVVGEAARVAAAAVDPPEDLHASALYRRALVATLLDRALNRAAAGSPHPPAIAGPLADRRCAARQAHSRERREGPRVRGRAGVGASAAAERGSGIKFDVNGAPVSVEVEPRTSLADCLRHQLRLTGTHIGCEQGVCGACTVIVDGDAVRSCLMLAVQAEAADVVTIEGLSNDEALTPLQVSFRKHHAVQCGFCTPGMITTAHALLSAEPDADAARIREVLSGNLCRCTGYIPIVEAVFEARTAYRRQA